MWAALRYRRAQVVALVVVSALVVTCAAFAPIFARSVDQGALRSHIEQAEPGELATKVGRGRTTDTTTDLPGDLLGEVPQALTAVSAGQYGEVSRASEVVTTKGKQPSPVVVRARTEVCEHLNVRGECPDAAGEILVSSADQKANGWKVGTTLSVPQSRFTRFDELPPPVDLTVVGVYTVKNDSNYWLGARPDGKSGVPQPDREFLPGVDDLITTEATFADNFQMAQLQVDFPLDREKASLDNLPPAAAAAAALQETEGLLVTNAVEKLLDGVQPELEQTAVIVPFVALQLGLLCLVVLFLVAQAAVEQRRHDVALARLRGSSRAGARRILLGELAVPVLIGVPVGLLLAMALAVLVRRVMLPRGIPFEVPLSVIPWVLGALLVSLLAVAVAARPVLREPVSQLLRGVAPTTAGPGHRITEGIVVVLAAASAIGVATGALGGPAALAAPTLLAIAVGLLAARVLPALARRRGAVAMRRGRVARVVAAHGVARRSTARRVLVVTTVVTAVAVFGASAVVVADRNRQARAALETGAPAVLKVDAGTASGLRDGARAVDEAGVESTPVVTIQPSDAGAAATMAVDPEGLREVAHPSLTESMDTAALALPDQQPIDITGSRLTGTVRWDFKGAQQTEDPPALSLDLTTADGDQLSRDLHTLGPKSSGRSTLSAPVLCPDRCRLDGLEISTSGPPGSELAGTVVLADLAIDGTPLPVTDAKAWESADLSQGPGIEVSVKGRSLQLEVRAADGADVVAHVADVQRPLPGIAAAPVADRGETIQVTTVDGGQADVKVVQQVAALPAVTDNGVLLSLPALARTSNVLDVGRAEPQIWLGDASPAAIDRASSALEETGVEVRSVMTTDRADSLYDQSASAWGLQLALFGGVLAVLLAGVVLVVLAVSSWRQVVTDLAALRLSGVSRSAAGRALRIEWLIATLTGVLLGALCGVAGAVLAMPSIPLFTHPPGVPEPDLTPAWWAVALATLVTALILSGLCVWLARGIMRRVRLSAVRGEAT